MLPIPTKEELAQLPQSGRSKSQPTTPTRLTPTPLAPFKSSMGSGLNDAGGLTAATGEVGSGGVFGQLWRQRSWERASPTARGPTSIFFQRKASTGAARTLVLSDPAQVKVPKAKEPEHDEAFIEESGVKVVESRPQSEVEDSEEDDDSDHSGDDLYELEMVDDTITEENEDDEDEEHHHNNHHGKSKTKSESEKNEVQEGGDKSVKTDQPPIQSTGESSTNNELKVKKHSGSLSSASSASSNSGNSISNSSVVATSSLRAVGSTAPGSGLGKRDSSSSNSSKDSATASAETLSDEQKDKQLHLQRQKQQQQQEIQTTQLLKKQQQTIQAAIKRGTGTRVSLPATLRGPRHNFVIRKVSEPVGEASPARRNNDFIDPRLVELKSPDQSSSRPAGAPVWVKRQTQEAPAVISSAKASSGSG